MSPAGAPAALADMRTKKSLEAPGAIVSGKLGDPFPAAFCASKPCGREKSWMTSWSEPWFRQENGLLTGLPTVDDPKSARSPSARAFEPANSTIDGAVYWNWSAALAADVTPAAVTRTSTVAAAEYDGSTATMLVDDSTENELA